jgi:ABC-type sulfate transport system permease component
VLLIFFLTIFYLIFYYIIIYYYLIIYLLLFFFFFELFVDNFASILSFIFYPLRLEVARWSFLLKSMASLSCMVHSAVLFNILHLYQYL